MTSTIDVPHLRPPRPPGAMHRLGIALVAIAALLGALAAPLSATTPAQAASYGPGYDNADNGGNGHIGAYRYGGNNVYCLEPEAARPTGSTSNAGYQVWPTMNQTNNARVNWAISTYGQSSNPNWTSAVAMYVWSIAAATEYNSHGMSGDSWYIGRVPWSQRNTVLANLATLRAQDNSITAAPLTGTGQMTFQVDSQDDYSGTLSITLNPSNATGTVVLTNGYFLATDSNTISGVGDGAVLDIKGVPPTADGAFYKISAVGDFTASGGYAGNVQVLTTGSAQRLAGPGQPGASAIHLEVEDPEFRSTPFVPVLTSAVDERYLQVGQPFTDVFTFDVAEDPDTGLTNSWLQYGDLTWAPITADVTVYQTTSPVVEGGSIPADAVVFDSFTVTTSAADGPTVPYTVSTSATVVDTGYYVAVSVIRAADQIASVQPFLPVDYEWSDGWGLQAETSIVPPTGRSEATVLQARGLPVIDTAYLDGFIFDGAQVRFTAYQRPDDSTLLESDDPEAVDPEAVCTPGNLVHQVTQPAAAEVSSGDVTTLPNGIFDWVIEVIDDEGNVAWSAPCGVVSERSEVRQVLISTVASDGLAGAPITDTATISGTIDDGDELTFAVYGRAFTEDPDDPQPLCEPENLIWESEEPILLEPGVVDQLVIDSPDVEVPPGIYWWVETLAHADGEIVHQGECGLDVETSRATAPDLADTGVDEPAPLGLIALGIGTVGAGLVLISVWRNRRRGRHVAV